MSNPKTYLCIFANIKQNSKVELTLDSPPSGWPLCRSGLGLRSWRKLLRQHYFPSGASHVDTPPSFCPENTHRGQPQTNTGFNRLVLQFQFVCFAVLHTIQKRSNVKCCAVFLCSVNILGNLRLRYLLTFSQMLLCMVPALGSSGVSPWCSPSGRGRH